MVRPGRVLTRGVHLGLVKFEFSHRIALLTMTGLVSMHGVCSVRSISFVERGCVVGLGWEFGFPLAVNNVASGWQLSLVRLGRRRSLHASSLRVVSHDWQLLVAPDSSCPFRHQVQLHFPCVLALVGCDAWFIADPSSVEAPFSITAAAVVGVSWCSCSWWRPSCCGDVELVRHDSLACSSVSAYVGIASSSVAVLELLVLA